MGDGTKHVEERDEVCDCVLGVGGRKLYYGREVGKEVVRREMELCKGL